MKILRDLLRDGAWQSSGVLIAVALAILIFYLQSKRKELAFGVLSDQNLLTVSEEVSQRVKITFDSEPVSKLHVVIVGIKNSGEQPIQSKDYEGNIQIEVNGNGKILSIEPVRQFPNYLNAVTTTTKSKIELTPLLLNPGDFVVIKILYAGLTPQVTCLARISGVSTVMPLNRGVRFGPKEQVNFFINAVVLTIFSGLYFVISYYYDFKDKEALFWMLMVLWGFIIFSTLLDWVRGLLSNSKRRYIDDI